MKRSRKLTLFFVVLSCLAFSSLVAGSFYRQERRETVADFTAEVDALAGIMHQNLNFQFEALYLLKSLFDGSTQVTGDEFHRVADETLDRHPHLLALGWVPRITGGEAEPAFPLHYLAARGHRSDLLGVDLATVPAIQPVLLAAATRRQVRLTAQLPLFEDAPQVQGMLALLPVFGPGAKNEQPILRGFVVGLFPLGDLLAELLATFPLKDIDLTLLDTAAPPSQDVLFAQASAIGPGSIPAYHKQLTAVAGRQLSLRAQPTVNYLVRHGSRMPLLIMLSGLLISFLLAAYLRGLVARSAEIEQLVEARTRKLHEANEKLATLSMTDGLTGIANRRNFDSHLEVEWKRGIREQQPLTLMLIDIDFFKAYNDHYGHLEGDRCLRHVARILNEQISRPRDLVARYGGEEFALILPHTDQAAQTLGEQCRAAIEALALPHVASSLATVITVSVGIATQIPQRGSRPTELIARADQALYQAKSSGRNRVVQSL